MISNQADAVMLLLWHPHLGAEIMARRGERGVVTFPWPMSDCFATLTPPFTAFDISRGGARPRGPAAMIDDA